MQGTRSVQPTVCTGISHHLFYHGLWVVLEEHPIMLTDSPVNSVRLGTHDEQCDGFLHTVPTNVSETVEVTTCSTTCTLLPRAADFGKR